MSIPTQQISIGATPTMGRRYIIHISCKCGAVLFSIEDMSEEKNAPMNVEVNGDMMFRCIECGSTTTVCEMKKELIR